MRQTHAILTFETPAKGTLEITPDIASWLRATGIENGLLTLFCQHTSASLLINENAAPAVRRDIENWLDHAAPEGPYYEHDDEGPDDMPAHIRTMLTGESKSIPVSGGRMMLGQWQGVFLFEHRNEPHRRHVVAQIIGD